MTVVEAPPTTRLLLGPAPDGPVPLLDAADLLARLEAAEVNGRGGAGFPTARKLRSVMAATRRDVRPVVVGNAMEGEPLSSKDAVLLMRSPGLVLDGLSVMVRALGADRSILALGPRAAATITPVTAAAVRARGVELRPLADGFVAGQESALVSALDGGPPVPRDPLVRVSTRGVDGRPTLVLNAETLAHVAWVARGVVPTTTLYSVTGDVAHAGVVEGAIGGRLADVLVGAGPGPGPVLVGGYHGAWLPADARHTPLTRADLTPYGASPGAGVLHVLDPRTCPLTFTHEVATYLAHASARQCGPCVNGLPRLAETVGRLVACEPDPGLVTEVERLRRLVTGRGACAHPDGTARLVGSTLLVFADHVRAHLAGYCPTGLS